MSSPDRAQRIEYVSAYNIRRMFNESQLPCMIADGLMKPEYLRNDHLSQPEKKGKPQCTHSQVIRYYDASGLWIVEIHQYWHKDERVAGTRRPDPKRLRLGNVIYVVKMS